MFLALTRIRIRWQRGVRMVGGDSVVCMSVCHQRGCCQEKKLRVNDEWLEVHLTIQGICHNSWQSHFISISPRASIINLSSQQSHFLLLFSRKYSFIKLHQRKHSFIFLPNVLMLVCIYVPHRWQTRYLLLVMGMFIVLLCSVWVCVFMTSTFSWWLKWIRSVVFLPASSSASTSPKLTTRRTKLKTKA